MSASLQETRCCRRLPTEDAPVTGVWTKPLARYWRLRVAQAPLIACTHAQARETIPESELARCRDTGQALTAGLTMGLF